MGHVSGIGHCCIFSFVFYDLRSCFKVGLKLENTLLLILKYFFYFSRLTRNKRFKHEFKISARLLLTFGWIPTFLLSNCLLLQTPGFIQMFKRCPNIVYFHNIWTFKSKEWFKLSKLVTFTDTEAAEKSPVDYKCVCCDSKTLNYLYSRGRRALFVFVLPRVQR